MTPTYLLDVVAFTSVAAVLQKGVYLLNPPPKALKHWLLRALVVRFVHLITRSFDVCGRLHKRRADHGGCGPV